MISLRDITRDNWQTATTLTVRDDQKGLVAPNWHSMLQVAYAESERYHKAIYNDEEMVGYVLIIRSPDDGSALIDQLMIAQEQQGKGYGRDAMKLIIDDLKARYNPSAIFISIVPPNPIARTLYESLGFADTGRIEDGERVFRRSLTS